MVNHYVDLDCPGKMWIGKLTRLDMSPLGWLGHKINQSTAYGVQVNTNNIYIYGGNSNECQQHNLSFYKVILKHMLLVIWIASLVQAIQMSTNNICFYKENQKEHHWIVPHEVLC